MDFSVFEITQIAIDVLLAAAIGGLIWYWLPKLRTDRRMVQVMTAKSQAVPTDAKLIEEWAVTRDTYRKGSKKWIEYTKHLKAEGYEN